MRIAYLSSSYVPSRRASSVQVMKMCAAFSRQGHEVQLVTKRCSSRQESGVTEDFGFYGVAEGFGITKLDRPAWKGGGLIFTRGLLRFLRANRSRIDLAYCRDAFGALLATRLSIPTVFEVHEPQTGLVPGVVLRNVLRAPHLARLVAISGALANHYATHHPGLTEDKLLVAHDGAEPVPDRAGASRRTDPPSNATRRLRVGYVGQLYPGKGLEILLPLAELLTDVDFEIVGGMRETLERLAGRELPPNLTLSGYLPPSQIADCYESFDVVVMPYQHKVGVAGGRSDVARWMSPLKMFEYMAAARPIVSSDLPVLREVLEDERNSLLVPPHDLAAWARAIRRLQSDPGLRERLGSAARSDQVARHTWDQRALAVLAGLPRTAP